MVVLHRGSNLLWLVAHSMYYMSYSRVRSCLESGLSVVAWTTVVSSFYEGEGLRDRVTCGAVPGFFLGEFAHAGGMVYSVAYSTVEG